MTLEQDIYKAYINKEYTITEDNSIFIIDTIQYTINTEYLNEVYNMSIAELIKDINSKKDMTVFEVNTVELPYGNHIHQLIIKEDDYNYYVAPYKDPAQLELGLTFEIKPKTLYKFNMKDN